MAVSPDDQPKDEIESLERRVGSLHLRRRLGLERDHEALVFGRGGRIFHLENWYSIHSVIRNSLRLSGMYGRAQRNARDIRVVRNDIALRALPPAFEGYTILQVSDLHVDMDERNTHALIERIRALRYDCCFLTGDFRARTFGPYEATVRAMESVRLHLADPIFGVLGNHDTIHLVTPFEAMGIRMLINESEVLERSGQRLYLAGIDDAHYYHTDNLEKASGSIPEQAVALLLSHTPEPYRHAAHVGFDAMFCGHTHGGQICLPGGRPLTWDAKCPRELASGAWRYADLLGYTSVGAGTSIVNARLNCLPEVTLHRLVAAR